VGPCATPTRATPPGMGGGVIGKVSVARMLLHSGAALASDFLFGFTSIFLFFLLPAS
jgi:hypothetical protein